MAAILQPEHIPSRVLWMAPGTVERGFEQRSQYMRRGFVELGIEVLDSEELTELRNTDYAEAKSCQMFDLYFGEKTQRVWYDSGDFPPDYRDIACTGNDAYFKVSLRPEYAQAPYVYPIAQRAYRQKFADMLEELRKIRVSTEQLGDYSHDFLAIFRATEAIERSKTVLLIRKQSWNVLSGVSPYRNRELPPECISRTWFDYGDYMRLTARCRLGLSLLGTSGDTSCRRVENAAIGLCGLVPEDGPLQPGPWKDGMVCFKNDLSDFVPLVEHYLHSPEDRRRVGDAGMQYWEDYASPKGQASYILRVLAGLEDPWIGVNSVCG